MRAERDGRAREDIAIFVLVENDLHRWSCDRMDVGNDLTAFMAMLMDPMRLRSSQLKDGQRRGSGNRNTFHLDVGQTMDESKSQESDENSPDLTASTAGSSETLLDGQS